MIAQVVSAHRVFMVSDGAQCAVIWFQRLCFFLFLPPTLFPFISACPPGQELLLPPSYQFTQLYYHASSQACDTIDLRQVVKGKEEEGLLQTHCFQIIILNRINLIRIITGREAGQVVEKEFPKQSAFGVSVQNLLGLTRQKQLRSTKNSTRDTW